MSDGKKEAASSFADSKLLVGFQTKAVKENTKLNTTGIESFT